MISKYDLNYVGDHRSFQENFIDSKKAAKLVANADKKVGVKYKDRISIAA